MDCEPILGHATLVVQQWSCVISEATLVVGLVGLYMMVHGRWNVYCCCGWWDKGIP